MTGQNFLGGNQKKDPYAFDMDDPFVVYCSDDDCGSSEELSYELQSYGFTNILLFKGGWKQWQEANYPTSKTWLRLIHT